MPETQPLRKTPIHGWHALNGAHWEPVGLWRRAYAYPHGGEDVHAAVAREVLTVRNKVGMLEHITPPVACAVGRQFLQRIQESWIKRAVRSYEGCHAATSHHSPSFFCWAMAPK